MEGPKFKLKPLSHEGVRAALKKAEHYRLLNEPREAESICLDILEVEPDNQAALVCLLLSISDQIGRRQIQHTHEYVDRLTDPYQKAYYSGLMCERSAKAALEQLRPRYQHDAYEWLREAMEHYEEAEKIRPPGNEDAILRWNTCVRILQRRPELCAPPDEDPTSHLLE